MSASSAIKKRLQDLEMTQIELARQMGTTRQNLGNKMNRDNFSTKELSEICEILGLKLTMVEANPGKYVIEYQGK